MDVDDQYTLYVNGICVGSDDNWSTVEVYHVPCLYTKKNVFAVRGHNGGGPGGFIATIQIIYDDGSSEIVRTDTSWAVCANEEADREFMRMRFDDSKWVAATDVSGMVAKGAWPGLREAAE
ncbi:hypothetical protein HGRIS_005264 [Hohenbuehelia grisea]|uniref:Lectin n=1 Tax=Hohenbuehelia grisea TaxID=104357 RepID=A0ABR3JFC6_9AGAR